jgi:ubiquinone/menaquinone biosynthesis C-methylase UbiE
MADATLFRCPVSRQRLTLTGDRLVSEDGRHSYAVVHGVPDFRLFDPPYSTRAEEQDVCDKLVRAAESATYAELLRYLELELEDGRSEDAKQRGLAHRLALRERAPRRLEELLARADGARVPAGGRVLDLGCGSGEATGALKRLGAGQVVGVDISMVELMLARKLLAECGVDATLIAGCAEALPFADGSFDFVFSPDVIEHVSDQKAYLREAWRVLVDDGQLVLNSPNRFSVVCPEPHVGVWFLTFLPRPLIDPVCRLIGKGPYTGKRLLSLRELDGVVRSVFRQSSISGRASNPNATGLSGRLFHATSPLSERVFAHLCDQHVVRATR